MLLLSPSALRALRTPASASMLRALPHSHLFATSAPMRFAALVSDHAFGFLPQNISRVAFTSSVLQLDDQSEDDVYKKYAEKLKKKGESLGISNLDELKKYASEQSKPEPESPPPSPSPSGPEAPQVPPKRTPPKRKDGLPPTVKKLDEIMQLDKVATETPERIGEIWNTYYSSKPNYVSALVPGEFYKKLSERAKTYPMFILPLPRDQGFEFVLLQFSGNQTFLTPLIEYQTHRENARPHLVLNYYTDLVEDKGIVLMSGELGATESGASSFSISDAQNLVYQMQLFYVTGPDSMTSLVERFNKDPANFDYQLLITEASSLTS
ncbi:ATP11 protein-domain-containing protein [Polychytrium aggregatum]|uniref:ATP11 protein-domain-containing protein n=1 Tax=Polychytrium aggregatum TaxID=110093 RepID=UPI0022FEABFD|nr:ATP11 protein-domain-containing protein [Polychytrium aggregatum]KAI9209735.1 ATP11 protein-domain-containing protein [Polychytrium aggregatum]